MIKRALVLGGGGLLGAYGAGVCSVLSEHLSQDYFNNLYASSVGVYTGTFYIAGESKIIENTWRNHVDGTKLVNIFNVLKGKSLLNLEYLSEIFQNKTSRLNVNKVFKSKTKLTYTITDAKTKKVNYVHPKKDNIFTLMRASTAIPLIHNPIKINKKIYRDSCIPDYLLVNKAIKENDEVLFVSNFWQSNSSTFFFKLFSGLNKNSNNIREKIEKNYKVKILKPSKKPELKNILDTNKLRIIRTIKLGKKDAIEFLKKHNI